VKNFGPAYANAGKVISLYLKSAEPLRLSGSINGNLASNNSFVQPTNSTTTCSCDSSVDCFCTLFFRIPTVSTLSRVTLSVNVFTRSDRVVQLRLAGKTVTTCQPPSSTGCKIIGFTCTTDLDISEYVSTDVVNVIVQSYSGVGSCAGDFVLNSTASTAAWTPDAQSEWVLTHTVLSTDTQGPVTVSFFIKDQAGNAASQAITTVFDSSPPVIGMSKPKICFLQQVVLIMNQKCQNPI
jgi:hypothetical protein